MGDGIVLVNVALRAVNRETASFESMRAPSAPWVKSAMKLLGVAFVAMLSERRPGFLSESRDIGDDSPVRLIDFGGLDFYCLKKRGGKLVHVEFNQKVL